MIISISFGFVPVWARTCTTTSNITVSASSLAAFTDLSASTFSSVKQRTMPMDERVPQHKTHLDGEVVHNYFFFIFYLEARL